MGLFSESQPLSLRHLLFVPIRRDDLLTALSQGDDTVMVKLESPALEASAVNPVWHGQMVVECGVAGEEAEDRTITQSKRRHQFWIPIGRLLSSSGSVVLRTRNYDGPAGTEPEFVVTLESFKRAATVEALERKIVWIFSSARSGTTWLIHDIFGRLKSVARPTDDTGSRPLDETGLDQVLGSYTVFPEHLHAMSKSGIDASAHFNRICDGDKARPQFFFAQSNRTYIKSWIRESYVSSILNEWGTCDYDRAVVKSPNGSHAADLIMESMPKSKMIFLVRDPRDVIKSRFSPFGSEILATSNDPSLRKFAIQYYASFWNFQLTMIERAYARCRPDRRLLVKYEDLRSGNLAVFNALLAFAGGEATASVAAEIFEKSKLENIPKEQRGPHLPRNTGKVGGFKEVFSADEIATMERILAPRLKQYGYLK